MKDTIKYFEANDLNPDEQMLLDKFEEKISHFITPKPRPATAPGARRMNLLAVFDKFPGLNGNKFGVWVVTLKKNEIRI